MKKYLLLTAIVVMYLGVFAVPSTGRAYFTTDQSATVLSGGAAYTVTYTFGSPHYDLYLPIRVERAEAGSTTTVDAATYSIVTKDDTVSERGNAKGIVLSSAEIRDGQYFIPKGEARKMTLLVAVATSSKEFADTTPRQLALQVTSLPFVLVDEGKKLPNGLRTSELRHYKTPYAKVFPKQ